MDFYKVIAKSGYKRISVEDVWKFFVDVQLPEIKEKQIKKKMSNGDDCSHNMGELVFTAVQTVIGSNGKKNGLPEVYTEMHAKLGIVAV